MSDPKVVIDNEVYRKIMFWVNQSQYEVSGLGKVVWDEKTRVFRVTSAILLPQKNTKTHTEIDTNTVVKAMFDLRNEEGDLRFWWHSHVKMDVFWSMEDMETIRDIGSAGWMVATVFNQNHETRSAFYGVGALLPTFIDEVTTEVTPFQEPKAPEWAAEYAKNVTNVVFTPPSTPTPSPVTVGKVYVKRDGVLVELKPETATAGTNTTAGSQSGGTTTVAQSDYATKKPPESRPAGMPKREYKRWKREWRAAEANRQQLQSEMDQERREIELAKVEASNFRCYATDLPITYEDFVQPYPFTQDELRLLAMEAIAIDDLDFLLANGFDRNEILESVFEKGMQLVDMYDQMENAAYKEMYGDEPPVDEHDIPVADRARMVH